MITIDKLNELPEKIKNDILNYAEFIMSKYDNLKDKNNIDSKKKWADVTSRGYSIKESASSTVLLNREEEKW
jgi:hypothetical protein